MRLTFDANCLFNLHSGTGELASLERLRRAHAEVRLQICVPSIQASENRRGGVVLGDYEVFSTFVAQVVPGWKEILSLGYYDLSFWDRFVYGDEAGSKLDRSIHSILFPEQPFDNDGYPAEGRLPNGTHPKWKNRKCDVLAMWAHIWNEGDVFVTEDANFHKASKKPALVALGAKAIWTPDEACAALGLS